MDSKFFHTHVLSVHDFACRLKAAIEGIKPILLREDTARQALAVEALLRLETQRSQIKYAAGQLAFSMEELENRSVDEMKQLLDAEAEGRIRMLHEQVYAALHRESGCSFEVIDTGYKKALIELRAHIERTFWRLEALAAEERRKRVS